MCNAITLRAWNVDCSSTIPSISQLPPTAGVDRALTSLSQFDLVVIVLYQSRTKGLTKFPRPSSARCLSPHPFLLVHVGYSCTLLEYCVVSASFADHTTWHNNNQYLHTSSPWRPMQLFRPYDGSGQAFLIGTIMRVQNPLIELSITAIPLIGSSPISFDCSVCTQWLEPSLSSIYFGTVALKRGGSSPPVRYGLCARRVPSTQPG